MRNLQQILGILAVASATAFAGCAVTSGQSTVGEYVDDATLTARVKARMAEDPSVGALRLNVETQGGTVQLSGFATSTAEKDRAGSIARAVPQVKSVRNDIVVRPPARQ